jgi:hypothetical protein
MSKLVFDKVGERFLETGVDHVVLYLQDAKGEYPKGIAWNGITGITESPSGAEANDLYADNIKYATLRSAETYGATITAYQSPEEFDSCDGTASIADGVVIGQQARNPFGYSYRTLIQNDTASEGDDGYKLHLVYNATASPSERSYTTVNDSPEGIELSWEVTTTPVDVPGYKPASTITINSTKADKTKLTALEDLLYGTEDTDAKLPLPSEIIEMFGAASDQEVVTEG